MTARAVRHPGELRWETRLLGTVTAVLLAFGIAATYGAASLVTVRGENVGPEFALRQLSGAAIGGVLLLLASRQDYWRWRQLAWPILLGTIVLLAIPLLPFTHAIAPSVNGARRWLDLGPINFQPSELARLAVVIWCAMLASKKGEQVRDFKKGVLPFVSVLGLVAVLILLEPNLSMATLVALLGGLVLFASGARIGHFILVAGCGVILVFHQIRDAQYRLARLLTFLNPGDATTEAGFQIHQSLVGIGSGGFFGTGFGQGQQKLGYLPYAYSDFLFSTIGEEWGFVGVFAVVFLFALFCWLGFRIARTASDPFGQYLALGLTATIGLTAFMHMAVSLGLMPTTGLTLPFMSYGRSSLVISLLGTGILINIGRLRAPGPGRAGQDPGRLASRRTGAVTTLPASEPRARRGAEPSGQRKVVLIAGGGTGGHLMPALAIASALAKAAPRLEPVLVGAVRGVEATLLPERDFRYVLLPSEPIYRRTWWKNLRWPLLAGELIRRVDQLFRVERPAAVLGTGGYASAPVVWWAARRGIPTAIQEQNAYPGLATRWLSRRVRHVYLGLPEARRLLRFGRATEVFDTGNPITPPSPERRPAALAEFGLSGSRPVVLVTGGSQGALALNRAVAGWLDRGGPTGADLLWVTGRATHAEFTRYHRPPAVRVVDFLDPMADGYAAADLVVSRAGMITVAELCAWGLPSILVPLPTAAADHQTHNATVLADAGAARLLLQSGLTPEVLAQSVTELLREPGQREAMAARAKARGRPYAASEIVSRLLTLLK